MAALLWLAGCGNGPADRVCEPTSSVSALTNATPSPGLFPLTDLQQAAIGLLRSDADPEAYCTASLVAPDRVLTAAHCDGSTGQHVELAGLSLGIADRHVHEELDLMVLELEPAVPPDSATPLRQNIRPPQTDWLGGLVQLAGRGLDGQRGGEALGFVVEAIDQVAPTTLRVDGQGRSGACAGDSGGPLLMRADDGLIAIVGVLSAGSGSCTGVDRYVRTDVAADWLQPLVSVGAPAGCDGATEEGTCHRGLAIYCDADGALQVDDCSDSTCGFDADQAGYRCIEASDQPCGEVDLWGQCEGSVPHICREGQLEQTDCSACGQVCGRSAVSGEVTCL